MLFLGNFLQAQRMHHFDVRKFNLGFTMGANLGRYKMTSFPNSFDEDTQTILKSVQVVAKPGFTIGLITNLKIINNIDIRLLPSVSLEQRDFKFFLESKLDPDVDSLNIKKIESAFLNIPFMVKFKSDFYKAYRVYAQFGVQLSVNMASTKKVRTDPDLLKTITTDFSFVSSVGIDLYGERLKLNPELRYALGLVDVYVPKNTRFAGAITELFSQSLSLLINFE